MMKQRNYRFCYKPTTVCFIAFNS